MGFYRKRPIVIEARQFSGTTGSGGNLIDWARSANPDAGIGWYHRRVTHDDGSVLVDTEGTLAILTLEGKMDVAAGDWLIRGVKGEFYPCKPDIFAASYEPAQEQ